MKMKAQRKLAKHQGSSGTLPVAPSPSVEAIPEGMYMKVVLVTPDMALGFLEKNHPSNREVKYPTVKKYAASVLAGTWTLSPQGFVFDEDGLLIDGQHRCWAIVEANVSVLMSVTYGAPRRSFGVLDQGKNRSVADLSGNPFITSRIASVARVMARGVVQTHVGPFDDRDPTLLIDFIERQRATLEAVMDMLPPARNGHGTAAMSATVLGAVARAYPYEVAIKLQRFCQVFINGFVESEAEKPIIMLRDFCKANATERTVIYQKAQRAIKAYCHADPIKTLYATSDDIYPLPGMEPRRTPSADQKYHRKRNLVLRAGQEK